MNPILLFYFFLAGQESGGTPVHLTVEGGGVDVEVSGGGL